MRHSAWQTRTSLWALLGSLPLADTLAAQTHSPSAAPDDDLLGEIVVTGSRLPVVAEAGAPVIVLDRRDIERVGATARAAARSCGVV